MGREGPATSDVRCSHSFPLNLLFGCFYPCAAVSLTQFTPDIHMQHALAIASLDYE